MMKETGIKDKVIDEIIEIAKQNDISKVILFGSRARGDYRKKSDIDLAVSGGNFYRFALDVDETTSTLLEYDFVNLDKGITKELQKSIDKDGVIIYEKI